MRDNKSKNKTLTGLMAIAFLLLIILVGTACYQLWFKDTLAGNTGQGNSSNITETASNQTFPLKTSEQSTQETLGKITLPSDTNQGKGKGNSISQQDGTINLADKSKQERLEKYKKMVDEGYKFIALTFDDGPYAPVDQRLLNLLNQYGGHASFFMVGSNIGANGEIIQSILEQGSEIGNHTFNHPDLTKLSPDQVQAEFKSTEDALAQITDYKIKLFRPPYGAYNQNTLDLIPHPFILWNVDTMDWSSRDADAISQALMQVFPGAIVLMHSLYPATADAVERVMPILYDQGYRFVTVSDLFEIYGIDLLEGRAYNTLKTAE